MSQHLNLLSMTLKVKNGRWTAICSDDQPDLAGDTATVELFTNFIKRAEANNTPPYLSVAHYFMQNVPEHLKSVLGEHGVAGWADRLMVSNGKLIASGSFENSLLGQKTMMAIASDQINGSEYKSRISIGFTDIRHSHGGITFIRRSLNQRCPLCERGHKRTFLDGELIHAAVTRVPVNPRSDIEVEAKSMADVIETMQQDAASIVGDEVAEALEEVNKVVPLLKSVVTKSEGVDIDAIRQMIKDIVAEALPPVNAVATAEVQPEVQGGDFAKFVADLDGKLKSAATIEQAKQALAVFNDSVLKSVPVTPPSPEVVQLSQAVSTVAQSVNEITQTLASLTQQIQAISAVVNRSQASPVIGVPPASRVPILVENPAASPNGQQSTQKYDSVALAARRSSGLTN